MSSSECIRAAERRRELSQRTDNLTTKRKTNNFNQLFNQMNTETELNTGHLSHTDY